MKHKRLFTPKTPTENQSSASRLQSTQTPNSNQNCSDQIDSRGLSLKSRVPTCLFTYKPALCKSADCVCCILQWQDRFASWCGASQEHICVHQQITATFPRPLSQTSVTYLQPQELLLLSVSSEPCLYHSSCLVALIMPRFGSFHAHSISIHPREHCAGATSTR